MDSITLDRLHEAYAEHPLSAAAILARLRRRLGDPMPPLTELDLAVDLVSGITDQNHAGGLEAVVELARPLGCRPGARFLDVGGGLGGPARILAHLYNCSVVGVELTSNRYRDAKVLTDLVGMAENVQFVHDDFLSVDFPPASFDGVILLDSFGHFPDKAALLNKCLTACRPNGRVVIQDVLKRRFPKRVEEQQLEELAGHWNVMFSTSEDWLPILAGAARVEEEVDLHVEFHCHLRRLLALANAPENGPAVPREKQACELALKLSHAGVIGYFRLILSRL
ncbi:MAG: class I SAM-dependent methyltransferase [Gemmataceae bacterium]